MQQQAPTTNEHASEAVLPVTQCVAHRGQEHMQKKKELTRTIHKTCTLPAKPASSGAKVSGVVKWMA